MHDGCIAELLQLARLGVSTKTLPALCFYIEVGSDDDSWRAFLCFRETNRKILPNVPVLKKVFLYLLYFIVFCTLPNPSTPLQSHLLIETPPSPNVLLVILLFSYCCTSQQRKYPHNHQYGIKSPSPAIHNWVRMYPSTSSQVRLRIVFRLKSIS